MFDCTLVANADTVKLGAGDAVCCCASVLVGKCKDYKCLLDRDAVMFDICRD